MEKNLVKLALFQGIKKLLTKEGRATNVKTVGSSGSSNQSLTYHIKLVHEKIKGRYIYVMIVAKNSYQGQS